MLAGLMLALALQGREILAVRCDPVSDGVAVKILLSEAIAAVEPVRTEEGAVIELPAPPPRAGLEMPRALPPLQSISFEEGTQRARLRLTWLPGTVVDSRVEGSLITLRIRGLGARDEPAPTPDVKQLYQLLFPQTVAADPTAASPAERPEPPEDSAAGLSWGPFRIAPLIVLRYTDASAAYLEGPQPVPASYFELQPGLQIATPDASGTRLSLNYEARLRTGVEDIAVLSRPTHRVRASLAHPLGPAWLVTASDHFDHGTLETHIVDPGREYFFNLGTFGRNEVALALRSESVGRLEWDLEARRANEWIEPGTGYFSNVRERLLAGTRYELGDAMKATLQYAFERIPPPETRKVIEGRAHNVSVGLDGDISPLVRLTASAGLRNEQHPRAAPGGQSFRGLTYSASLRREVGTAGSLTLGAERATQPSGFESNAFYIVSGVQATYKTALPYGAQLSLATGYQRNDYRLDAAALGEPRRDRLWGWSAGIGRSLTRRSFARADYSWDRRRSNLAEFRTTMHSFMVQVGYGPTTTADGR